MSQDFDIPVGLDKSKMYGVYLLCSQSEEKQFKGKCYIGFTVNPCRRIRQHNRGKDFGGAKKTSNRGPWKMILLVHGFPNNIAALQFEWAWQQPSLSSRLKHYTDLKKKQRNELDFRYKFRILSRMLNLGPWKRLPLVIQWLDEAFICQFDKLLLPPSHMIIIVPSDSQKPINSLTQQPILRKSTKDATECHLCMKPFENNGVSSMHVYCLNNLCIFTSHIICLANHFLIMEGSEQGHYIPIKGECPLCEATLFWGDLIRQRRQGADFNDVSDSSEESHSGENIINLLEDIKEVSSS